MPYDSEQMREIGRNIEADIERLRESGHASEPMSREDSLRLESLVWLMTGQICSHLEGIENELRANYQQLSLITDHFRRGYE